MTYELTAGITDQTSLGFMFLTGRRIHHGLEYAGWRMLPHLYVPRSWGLPFDLGLVTELSFQRTVYEENSRRVEIRPIIEKRLGRFQADLNPVFVRALHGPGTQVGWRFEPAARIAYDATRQFTPSLEYYSDWARCQSLRRGLNRFTRFFPAVTSNCVTACCGASVRASE